ncbi:MAG: bifunctional oligoribonuclease/PAP phosphatase NrnA [Chloroflexaceae bacterium]|nr:bifunctional oligoribonuclease/PAP phosphatase NrnA [Chloroflexaceae bacterium]
MIYTDSAQAAPAVAAMLKDAQRILVLSHVNPDGDAIGSMLGVWHALNDMGKTALPLASSAMPAMVNVLPGIEHVQVYEPGRALPDVDLIWMVDTASLARVGRIYEDHAARLEAHPLVIVDHHETNTGGGNVNFIDAHAASSAELVYTLLRAMDAPLSAAAATALLMGLTTDTQSFQTSSTRPDSLRIAADLIEAGADQQAIVRAVYYGTPYGTVTLLGQSLSHLQREGALVWTHISRAMQEQTAAPDDAYDDVVHLMQRIEGVRVCALFKERPDGHIKISLRSTPGINVATITKIWGGGGHAQAAGATLEMGLEAAQEAVLPHLRAALAGW